jgi:hypothetical protein
VGRRGGSERKRRLQRTWVADTRRTSVQRAGNRRGKLREKDVALGHVDTPSNGAARAGGPRAGVSVARRSSIRDAARRSSIRDAKGEAVGGNESRWRNWPQAGHRSMSMPNNSRIQSAAVCGDGSSEAGSGVPSKRRTWPRRSRLPRLASSP